MAFPENVVTFPVMKDIDTEDGALVAQFQTAIENQDMETALSILRSIPDYQKKIISATYLNSLGSTVQDLEWFYLQKFSPAYVVSRVQPLTQEKGDFWFEITATL